MSAAVADVRRADPRPALADVLAALTGGPRCAYKLLLWRRRLVLGDRVIEINTPFAGCPPHELYVPAHHPDLPRAEFAALSRANFRSVNAHGVGYVTLTRDDRKWRTRSPAEAVEVLATRDLWPWPVGDDASPRWWCERCGGTGRVSLRSYDGSGDPGSYIVSPDANGELRCDAFDVGTARHCGGPPTLAALVAVASLGVDALRRAEGLALQLVGRAPRLTFRVMSREALGLWADDGAGRYVAAPPQTIVHAACVAEVQRSVGGAARDNPWWLREAPADVVAAWPALRDLAALGVTPVALDGDRITLAVEAI